MAQLIIPPGYAQVAFRVRNATVGHTCIWTCGVQTAAAPWTPTEGAFFHSAVAVALAPMWDGNVTMAGFHALIGNDGPPMALDIESSVTGSGTAMQMAPPNVTYLAKKTTAFAGKSYRGRIYFPFVDNISITENGEIQATTYSRFAAAMTNLYNVPTTGTGHGLLQWVLLHTEGSPGASGEPTPITSFAPSNKVATQRRRLER